MKISTRGRYGLRVMMELACHHGKEPLLAETIAKNQDISCKYIHVIVTRLKAAGLIRSIRGPSGGYVLARDPSTINALEVVSALEGNKLSPVKCVHDPSFCSRMDRCAAHRLWKEVALAANNAMASFTIERLAASQTELAI